MANLDQLLGGILKDLGHARIAADVASRESLETYRSDPILAKLPLPRMVIQEARLTLRFVVEEDAQAEFDATLAERSSRLWSELVDRSLLELIAGRVADAHRPLVEEGVAAERSRPTRPPVTIGDALQDDPKSAVESAFASVRESKQRIAELLPPAQRRALTSDSALKIALGELLAENLDSIRRMGTAQAVLGRQLAVDVTKTGLAAAAPDQIHELSLVLRPDDIQLVEPGHD
ncbi:MAG: hypothetical protein M5U28_23270 [Sandaracinaceae bacterium]|nr:hypothetical protein [Sandaracinaceae bacterium]